MHSTPTTVGNFLALANWYGTWKGQKREHNLPFSVPITPAGIGARRVPL